MPQRSNPDTHSLTIPPPVNGWNTKDPISQMDPLYAVELENFFPNAGTVDLRNGYRQHATGVGSARVHTVCEYVQEDGDRFLLALQVTAGAVTAYDATSAGAASSIIGAASLVGDMINYVNYRGSIFFKEEENSDVYYWNGTGNLTAAAFTGPGGDDKLLGKLTTYKNRIYFSSITGTSLWYSGLDAITGALTEFSLSSLFRLGGRIQFIGSTSLSGSFIQEVFVIISDQGEVLLYQGDYPGSTTWGIVGRYYIPPPAGRRAFFYWGQDIIVITAQGLVALSKVINAGISGQYEFLSDSIAPSFSSLIQAAIALGAATLNYINGIVYPQGPFLLVNIPTGSATFIQLVMNLITGAWCKFTGINAYHWTLFNNNLYFAGTQGKVFKADNGYFDEDPASAGNAQSRTIKMRPAYNYFGNPSLVKQFVEARPIIYQSEGLGLTMDADVDYSNTTATSTVSDTTDTAYKLYTPRVGLQGIGYSASIRIDGSVTTKRMSLQATQVIFRDGDIV